MGISSPSCGVNPPRRGVEHPPSSSAETKERVALCLYYHFRTSWCVLARNLHLYYGLLRHAVKCTFRVNP